MTGELLPQPTGDTIEVLHTGDDTAGAYFELETVLRPGTKGPPAHRHRYQEESFRVVDGVVAIRYGNDWRDVRPDDGLVVVPRGVVHSFANRSDAPARMQVRETPAGPLLEQLRLQSRGGRLLPVIDLARLNVEHDLSLELAGLPVGLQRVLWRTLARLPRRRG